MSRAALNLRFAARTQCPHCGRKTKTVQGVCADCWGTKEEGHRQFFVRKRGGSPGWFPFDDIFWWPFLAALALCVMYALRSIFAQ